VSSPIIDLAGLTLEVTNLDRAEVFYGGILGLEVVRRDNKAGVLELRFSSGQRLNLWKPITRQHNDSRLSKLGALGGTHVHWAMQIPEGTRETAKKALDAHGVHWQEIDLGDDEFHDYGLYFYDPFNHGLELREIVTEEKDARAPVVKPGAPSSQPHVLPVVGLREVALAFTDFEAMTGRLPSAYGFALEKFQDARDFAQFTLAANAEPDGKHTPRRWLYAWDPQVGLADMLGGEHAHVIFYADVDAVERLARAAKLECMRDDLGLLVRDPEGHVFEFIALEDAR
jgi:catechol 2,3-dioxygenase-like lactoylglutathione lyase family enzyme